MRKFSELEKDYIKALVRGSDDVKSNFPIKILDPIFVKYRFDFDANDPRNPHLIFWRNVSGGIDVDVIVEINMKLFEISMLIDFLKENGLIYTINFGMNKREWKPNGSTLGFNEVDYKIDEKTSNALISCVNNAVFVGQTLKDMVQNNFKSIEEQTLEEAKKQTELSNAALEEARKQTVSANESLKETKKQTTAANQSLTEAQQQTQFARNSLAEAKKQTNRSTGAVIVAVVGVIVSIALSKCSVTLDEDQELFSKPIRVVDSTMLELVVDSIKPNVVKASESLDNHGKVLDLSVKNIKETLVEIRDHQNDTMIVRNAKAPIPASKKGSNH